MIPAQIRSGIPWYDDQGRTVNAHGGCIVEDDGRFYLFGEYKTDAENTFIGISCYSSTDLVNWTFERLALPQQPDGLLGPQRIGERPKVMRCPTTGQFIMYLHADSLAYADPYICFATSDRINGEYVFHGPLTHDGAPLCRWDMGTFQDSDGTGYLLLHEGDIYRLSRDYLAVEAQVAERIAEGGESPAMLRNNGQYFILFSNKTTWERNDNYYLSAPSISGPWANRGLIAPEGTQTHNSQCTFVLHVPHDEENDTYMYMGDRWSFPHQESAATYVWLPLTVTEDSISLPEFLPEWNIHDPAPTPSGLQGSTVGVNLAANNAGIHVEVPFSGSRVGIFGPTTAQNGYATVEVLDGSDENALHSGYVDFYSLTDSNGLRYLSPELTYGNYRLRITVTGEMPVCYNKAGARFGATDSYVTVTDIITFPQQTPSVEGLAPETPQVSKSSNHPDQQPQQDGHS